MAIVTSFGSREKKTLTREEFDRRLAIAEANAAQYDGLINFTEMPPLTEEEMERMVPWEEAMKQRLERRQTATVP
jgi:hypothetical protein